MKSGSTRSLREACASCTGLRPTRIRRLGVSVEESDVVVALAGNPNTGKSTVFNALTGLRQHTGNWPGKTVVRAEGGFEYGGQRYKLLDLPGTYSLLSTSLDEEIARDAILFGRPDVTVVVVDATRLERNLNLALQVLEITDRVIICLNLIDEAGRHGIHVDERQLARDLGAPVVSTAARHGQGLPALLETIHGVASGEVACRPRRLIPEPPILKQPLGELVAMLRDALPGLPNTRWVAMRLLGGDDHVMTALRHGEFGEEKSRPSASGVERILAVAARHRSAVGHEIHELLVQAIYAEAAQIAGRSVSSPDSSARPTFDQRFDRILTGRAWGYPAMLLLFALMFWITITGANIPSGLIGRFLLDAIPPWLKSGAAALGFPWWLSGVLIDGMYLGTAWVVSVMLPPMAIFFPLFTLLEDFGYLPRVAFNLDSAFRRAGAHGKQAMTMMMGFGCNAAGVVATRVIDSPRERLVAILTNNFALCNGRWPTQFLIAALFVGTLVPAHLAGVASAAAVTGVAVLGILATFAVSWVLSRTVLAGEVSTFSLELPPYRPPRFLQTLYTSLLDRTIFVLWRAIVFALPAGAAIWLSANIHVGGASVAEHVIRFLDPIGLALGLNGVILLAYVVAIPANEIVIPAILMLTVLTTGLPGVGHGAGVMFELDSHDAARSVLAAGGWTLLTGVNLMLFSLLHNPCSTTIYTIFKETGSVRWTTLATALPLAAGLIMTFVVARAWTLVG